MSIYALFGIEPEVQAYAMARYSRSALSMRESITELTAEKAEKFLTTFYFQYGHRSIADLAHIPFAIEDISILAAMRVVDEQLWDGQERSTRYQNFRAGKFVVPRELEEDRSALETFTKACNALFAAYESLVVDLVPLFREAHPRPEGMAEGDYTRTLRARAFDIARGLLPLATRTSLGQIVSARTVETQISRLLADPYKEVQDIGEALRAACREPAQNPVLEKLLAGIDSEQVDALPEPQRTSVKALLEHLRAPTASPTLVKYTEPSLYSRNVLDAVARIAAGLTTPESPDRSTPVALVPEETPEDEAVTTLLYHADPLGRSYRQIQRALADLQPEEKQRVLDVAMEHRGRHDDLLRELRTGYALKFDILMDLGAFRDLHRHRRCVQIIQDLTPNHGYDDPELVFQRGIANTEMARRAKETGLMGRYRSTLDAAAEVVNTLSKISPQAAHYALPLAYRTRALFKMDLAEAAYICEQRTAVTGHFSYRHVAWQMYQELQRAAPTVARHLRVKDPNKVIDLLSR